MRNNESSGKFYSDFGIWAKQLQIWGYLLRAQIFLPHDIRIEKSSRTETCCTGELPIRNAVSFSSYN
uniref:Uncharacterized protein n=1 Tax=Lepeophtheirus salmonis TaxID=72036 RepID=A0A0K2TP96_LEPSM